MKSKKTRKKKTSNLFKIVRLVVMMTLVIGLGACVLLLIKYEPTLSALTDAADMKIATIDVSTFKSRETTKIYDDEENLLKMLSAYEYDYLTTDAIPDDVKNATVAIEDERFYEHNGIDLRAYARVAWLFVKSGGKTIQGGSGITQQLVKNIFLTNEKSLKRKYEEMVISLKLEQIYSKDKILEFYLNNIYYNHGAYGIGAAAHTYFSKTVDELSLAETAMLVGIPNRPEKYDPVDQFDNAVARKDVILGKMKELGSITDQEYEEAIKEEIVLTMPENDSEKENYAVSYTISEAAKKLMELSGFEFLYDFDSDEARKTYQTEYNTLYTEMDSKIRSGGYSIYTSINQDKQTTLQQSLNDGLSEFKSTDEESGLYETQGAGVCIDNDTGNVVAIVGGRTQKEAANTFNRAYLAYRQPGSAIKPLIAYTPAFDLGLLPLSLMKDYKIEGGPKNSHDKFYGNVTLRYATEISINTIPYQILLKYKPQNLLHYLTDMEFSGIVDGDINAGIAIGGFTKGITPVELAGGYSTLSRNGSFIETTCLNKLIDISGNVVYENQHKSTQIYKEESAYMMTDVLQGAVSENYATGYGNKISGFQTAGKTGTTNDMKDGWFAGYTPRYTTVVWVGNDTPSKISGLYGSTYPATIWRSFMTEIHKEINEGTEFVMPDTIFERYVNLTTGEITDKASGGVKELVTSEYIDYMEKSEDAKAASEAEILKKQQEEEAAKLLEEATISPEPTIAPEVITEDPATGTDPVEGDGTIPGETPTPPGIPEVTPAVTPIPTAIPAPIGTEELIP
ncbi:MAG: transglycosylase domain-containing protein [Mobilitalea sp.]